MSKMMNNNNNWGKYMDVIYRLSSRVKNERNQSAMIDNCNTMAPLCIDKSFYQYKNDIGQGYCVEVCDTKFNGRFSNPIGSYRNQFISSKIFDNKKEYIDYIVTNVLRQVVNHVPFDCLHQLSCCLPQNIENILCHTDMDSDRLIRILVTDVLQSYGTNAGQLTDWYAFANLMKPFLSSTEVKDDKISKIPSKQDKLFKSEKSSERVLNNRIQTTPTNTSVLPIVKKKQSSETIAFNEVASLSTNTQISSDNRIPSPAVTPQIISTTDSITPMSIQSKEIFTPVGAKYQSKTKSNQNSTSHKSNTITHQQSLPLGEKSINQPSPTTSRAQYQVLSDSHAHYSYPHEQKSNKSSDLSSSSDCVLTIHHKYKHKRAHNHQHTTTNFDTQISRSLPSSHPPTVPDKDSDQKNKYMLVDTPSMITNKNSEHKPSQQNFTNNAEQTRASDLFNDKQMLLFKLLSSSDNATKHPHKTVLISSNNEHSIEDDYQLASFQDSKKSIVSSNENYVRMKPHSTSLTKKTTRINHYPNMLADFD